MKTAIITGGSEGLGRAIAEQLHLGYKVYILARREKGLELLARTIGCNYRVCDVVDYKEMERVFDDIADESGSIDILVNSAGAYIQGALEDNDASIIKATIDVNINGVINSTKAVIPYMMKQGSGTIIQINSQSGLHNKAEHSVYRASKWAITGFTKSLQLELEPHNIKVIGIHPGRLRTEFFLKQGIDNDLSSGLSTTEVAKTVKFILELEDSTFIPDIGIKKFPTVQEFNDK